MRTGIRSRGPRSDFKEQSNFNPRKNQVIPDKIGPGGDSSFPLVGAGHEIEMAERVGRLPCRARHCDGIGAVAGRGAADRRRRGAEALSGSLCRRGLFGGPGGGPENRGGRQARRHQQFRLRLGAERPGPRPPGAGPVRRGSRDVQAGARHAAEECAADRSASGPAPRQPGHGLLAAGQSRRGGEALQAGARHRDQGAGRAQSGCRTAHQQSRGRLQGASAL